jgi:hypothetical protein
MYQTLEYKTDTSALFYVFWWQCIEPLAMAGRGYKMLMKYVRAEDPGWKDERHVQVWFIKNERYWPPGTPTRCGLYWTCNSSSSLHLELVQQQVTSSLWTWWPVAGRGGALTDLKVLYDSGCCIGTGKYAKGWKSRMMMAGLDSVAPCKKMTILLPLYSCSNQHPQYLSLATKIYYIRIHSWVFYLILLNFVMQ